MELEAELFYRGPRGMEATEYGELLYARAKHICYLMDDIKKEFSIVNGNKGVLNVIVTYAAASAVPPEMLFGFSKINSNIQMKLKEYPDEYPLNKLFQEDVDIGFVLGHEDMDNCEYELIVPGEVVVLVSKGHRLATKDEISVLDLENEHFVVKSVEQGKEHAFTEKCLESGFLPHIEYEIGNIATAHVLAEANGLVAVSVDFLENEIKDEKLKVIKLKEKIPQNIYLVTRKRDIPSKAVMQYRTFIKEFVKNNNKPF
jgi:DNA-binding transcriptional LysR family regulator